MTVKERVSELREENWFVEVLCWDEDASKFISIEPCEVEIDEVVGNEMFDAVTNTATICIF